MKYGTEEWLLANMPNEAWNALIEGGALALGRAVNEIRYRTPLGLKEAMACAKAMQAALGSVRP